MFQFRSIAQLPTENIDKFHARLRQMAKNCNFHDEAREIKSQIIQKCMLEKVREKGLTEPDTTLDDLLKYARSLEISKIQSQSMMTNSGVMTKPEVQPEITQAVNKITSKTCRCCGGAWPHERREKCPAWGKECLKCRKQKHFAKHCLSNKPQGKKQTNFVEEDQTPTSQPEGGSEG